MNKTPGTATPHPSSGGAKIGSEATALKSSTVLDTEKMHVANFFISHLQIFLLGWTQVHEVK